jgi:hypothetical protein
MHEMLDRPRQHPANPSHLMPPNSWHKLQGVPADPRSKGLPPKSPVDMREMKKRQVIKIKQQAGVSAHHTQRIDLSSPEARNNDQHRKYEKYPPPDHRFEREWVPPVPIRNERGFLNINHPMGPNLVSMITGNKAHSKQNQEHFNLKPPGDRLPKDSGSSNMLHRFINNKRPLFEMPDALKNNKKPNNY